MKMTLIKRTFFGTHFLLNIMHDFESSFYIENTFLTAIEFILWTASVGNEY